MTRVGPLVASTIYEPVQDENFAYPVGLFHLLYSDILEQWFRILEWRFKSNVQPVFQNKPLGDNECPKKIVRKFSMKLHYMIIHGFISLKRNFLMNKHIIHLYL